MTELQSKIEKLEVIENGLSRLRIARNNLISSIGDWKLVAKVNKITAIKMYRSLYDCKLMVAKKVVDDYLENN